MTAREWYVSRAASWAEASADAERRANAVSRLRLIVAFAGVALLWWGAKRGSWPVAAFGVGAFGVFGWLVSRHARIIEARERAGAGSAIAAQGLARLDRDWRGLPEVDAPPGFCPETHPYARDLDIFGHGSLAQWLGRCATVSGGETLTRWLLNGAAGPSTDQQAAVVELARDRDWREALAIEGRLCLDDRAGIVRFVAWCSGGASPTPRVMRGLVPLLTISIWLLIALQATNVVAASWWIVPMIAGVVCSFAYAGKMYAAFDCASAGEGVLHGYAAMLALLCGPERTSARLSAIRDRVGAHCGAPRAMAKLARLIDWSEMRRAAALLHFPIQALTLWDFHVSFAIDRWRSQFQHDVAVWFDALGEADALSVLAAVAHDEPSWCMPVFEAEATSYRAAALGHPLIASERRVSNDVEVGPPGTLLLVTGSNMSGKSTLLRAIGLNAVLAQAGAPVCAAALAMPHVELQTSIRVEDSLERGLSYFMAALAALKRVVDAAETRPSGAPRLLYLLDEVLQGTNSAERAIAVRAVARHLLQAGAIGAMTTHDLTVAESEPLSSAARLVHFTEQVHDNGTMTFDYRLRPGLAQSRNAIRLMQLIGIQP
jgi:hypothetical protein